MNDASAADTNLAPFEADDVAEPQLPSTAAIHLVVDDYKAAEYSLLHVST